MFISKHHYFTVNSNKSFYVQLKDELPQITAIISFMNCLEIENDTLFLHPKPHPMSWLESLGLLGSMLR